jgi:hypothetical protein
MRAVIVVVAELLSHQAFQMCLVEGDRMVEQVAAAVSDGSLGIAVLPRTAEAGWLRLNTEALDSINDFFAKVDPVIKDQIVRCRKGRPRATAARPKRLSDTWLR